MRIILNSDVLHRGRLTADGLPQHIENFCRDAANTGCSIVLPRTALLEDERHQNQLLTEARAAIDDAVATLKGSGMDVGAVDSSALVKCAGLADALAATGAKVEVVEPS